MRQRQQIEEAMRRHAMLDARAEEEYKRKVAADTMERELAPYAPGDLVDDSIGKKYPGYIGDGQFIGTPGQRESAAKEAARRSLVANPIA